jgi:hypothetical protein
LQFDLKTCPAKVYASKMDQNKEMAMFSWNVRKTLAVAVAVAAMSGLAPRRLAAASLTTGGGAEVTFTASGTFSSTPTSGADLLELRGQPFTISVVGNSSLLPTTHGRNWAIFTDLAMSGTVYSGLVPNQAIPVSATTAAIDQTVGASEDIFQSGFPVTVVGIALTVRAYFTLPGGTMTKAFLRPFSLVTLPVLNANTYVTYSDTTATTELELQNGTLVATIPAGEVQKSAVASPSFMFHAAAQAVKPRWLCGVDRG